MIRAMELRWLGVLYFVGCGPPEPIDSSQPGGLQDTEVRPGDDTPEQPPPTVTARAVPRCGPAEGTELTTFSGLASADETRHHVVVVQRDGVWSPAEHIDMPMHHATALRWANLDDFQRLDQSNAEQLRFTFTVLSESREHRARDSMFFTTFVARVEMLCSASAPADRPEGVLFGSIDLDTSACPELEAAMVKAGRELGECTSDSQCTVVQTQMCGIEGLGCYWVATNRTRDASGLAEAVHAWRNNPCLAASCDCAGSPTAARCRRGQCVAP